MSYKFVLINRAPQNINEAGDLSTHLTTELGDNDWHLVSTTLMPSVNGAGLLLGFEREVEDNPTT